MDEQTKNDYIEDLLEERVALYEKLRRLEENVLALELKARVLMAQLESVSKGEPV